MFFVIFLLGAFLSSHVVTGQLCAVGNLIGSCSACNILCKSCNFLKLFWGFYYFNCVLRCFLNFLLILYFMQLAAFGASRIIPAIRTAV